MIPIIRSASDIRKDYNGIEQLAKKTRQPIYLTKNGRSSLVVIDADTFDYDQYITQAVLQAQVVNSAPGSRSYSVEEMKSELRRRTASAAEESDHDEV